MADLGEFYPTSANQSPRSDGNPTNPGASSGGGIATMPGGKHAITPAFWTIIIVAAALLVLNRA